MRAWTVIGAALTLVFASPAAAAELGSHDSSTFRITVNIPPIAAALAAQAEGAVGLWTVSSSQAPLMIKMPDRVSPDADVEAAVFSSGGMLFSLSAPQAPLIINATSSTVNNGLRREAFALRASGGAMRTGVTVLVSAT
ncbi:hypothetical protein [Sphingomonas sp.]|jgi:hypothetical protein|uniref:hypothetical protein n=1 Tax=Sphingomonas sp. TaxID=28214 RepID=UPI002608EAAC|nr:hypothetical protein [Sphingomonas sp.]MDF2602827.1 hypothetical protein [Sphingomonas sp.]